MLRSLAVVLAATGILMIQAPRAEAQAAPVSVLGCVRDPAGAPVADATLTLSGSIGARRARSDERGCVALGQVEPATYDLVVEAAGFRTWRLAGAVLPPGAVASIHAVLEPGPTGESRAPAGSLTLRGAESTFTLDRGFIDALPLERRDALTVVPDYFPGVARGSAFGAAAGTATAKRVDGIDLTDPLDGRPWTSHVATAADGITLRVAGTPAAEGGFTGAVLDVTTRPGGARLAGFVDALVTTDALGAARDASVAPPAGADDALTRAVDTSAVFGGPLVRQRASFSAAVGYAARRDDPAGQRTTRDENVPRAQMRLALSPSASQQLNAALLVDAPSIEGDAPADVRGAVDDSVSNTVAGRTIASRIAWQRSLGSRIRLLAGYGLLAGSRTLEPATRLPGRLDAIDGLFRDSQGITQDSDRQRHVMTGSIGWDLRGAGTHLFEAGGEIALARVDERRAFVDNEFYLDFAGRPNTVLAWEGSALEGRMRRESFFVQDRWSPAPRVTIDAGLRGDVLHGSAARGGEVYRATVLQPRAGIALDVAAPGTTVVRAHYGRYAEPLYFSHFDRATPGQSPLVTYEILPGGARREVERETTPLHLVDGGLAHPSMSEASLGLDQRLFANLRVGATGVIRDFRDFVDAVYPDARWLAIARTGLGNRPITVFRWINRTESEQNARIRNVDGTEYASATSTPIGTAEASRRYAGVIVHARLHDARGRWTVLGAATLAQARGTVDDVFASGIGRSDRFASPSASLVNVDGDATETPERELTLLATARVPLVGSRLSAVYIGQAGRRYAAARQFGRETLDFPYGDDGRLVLLEARGTRRLADVHQLDLRVEHGIPVGGGRRVALYVDVLNVLDRRAVLAVQDRFPVGPAPGGVLAPFEAPLVVQRPRQVYVGGRWLF